MALKDIIIADDWSSQNCDFKTYSQITEASSVSTWGHRQYSCNYNGMHFFADGLLYYYDYIGMASVLPSAITKDFEAN